MQPKGAVKNNHANTLSPKYPLLPKNFKLPVVSNGDYCTYYNYE